ncbi:MAG: hypothetical protein DMF73_16255 [Acidobacteria bacterium]|nr:MAG: hypothetical protein DMF73_16255 [Acidobacteriota bacterium]
MNVIGEVLLRSVTSVPKVVSLWRRFPIGSVALRTRYGAWSRAQYAYGTFHAAQQAKLLGLDGISVIEFGVDRATACSPSRAERAKSLIISASESRS